MCWRSSWMKKCSPVPVGGITTVNMAICLSSRYQWRYCVEPSSVNCPACSILDRLSTRLSSTVNLLNFRPLPYPPIFYAPYFPKSFSQTAILTLSLLKWRCLLKPKIIESRGSKQSQNRVAGIATQATGVRSLFRLQFLPARKTVAESTC